MAALGFDPEPHQSTTSRYASGSGGEYFVGAFDGKTFRCDHDINQSQWVDFGRDFYAPVSWSNIPKSDGRRIWIGWMNNWETSFLPTNLWRSAMSIPRALSLRRTADGFKLLQTPVKELQSLRGEIIAIQQDPRTFGEGEFDLIQRAADSTRSSSSDLYEIMAEFNIGTSNEFGFRLRKGHGAQSTIVGYDVAKRELFVDRTNSGDTSFHEKFAGRHSGPLEPIDGTVTMHVFLDKSSIEVFGDAKSIVQGGGETVITDRIFPDPANRDACIYSRGGTVTIKSLKAWKLKSAW